MLPFELKHGSNSLVISGFEYSQEDAKGGNPYNTTFTIAVVSEPFRGVCECEYDRKKFAEFASQIHELYESHLFKVELREICYGSHVSFELDRTGHITISGELFGHASIQSMTFEFHADQTSLKPFADSLKQVYQVG